MYRKDTFDTGEMRDGHKLLRNVCDEDGIEVVHPPSCQCSHEFGVGKAIYWPVCAWSIVHESYESILHAYVDGDDSPILIDLDTTLPRGIEVPVVWRYSGGANWTDYGWEYDAEFEWWFDNQESPS